MKIKKFFSILLCVLFLISPVQAFASAYVSDSQIVSAKTPSEASETELAWSLRFGNSYKDAPSNQTVVGDTLLVMSNKKILKLDVETGKTLKSADMVDMPSFGNTAPLYADGVIYCPLDNAKIQAFNFKTM